MGSRAFALLVVAATTSCGYAGYDSRWGQSAAVQRQHAAANAPTLRGDRAPDAPPNVQTLKVRALVAKAYATQVADVPGTLRELFADVNDVTEPSLGVKLTLDGIQSWEVTKDDDLPKLLATLRATELGTDVDWVAGFVGSLPRMTASFHDLGIGDLPGRYVVLRAPSSAQDHDATERAYAELSDGERRKVQKEHRRHRVAAVFLHEIGHTLGALHERSERNLMYPEYRPKMTTFGPETTAIMRGVLAKRDSKAPADQAAMFKEIAAGVRSAPLGVFFDQEKQQLLAQLDDRVERLEGATRANAAPAKRAAPPAAPQAAAPPAAPPPELSADDQRRFADANERAAKDDFAGAWETAKPLFAAYPKSMGVQDMRCTLATKVFAFAAARVECQPLMKLATDAK